MTIWTEQTAKARSIFIYPLCDNGANQDLFCFYYDKKSDMRRCEVTDNSPINKFG